MILIKNQGGEKVPKRYKKGNRKKKSKSMKPVNIFYNRERQLNKMIAKFKKDYYNLSYPPLDSEYESMNKQRLEIKRLFDLQDGELWKQSSRRNYFYRQQLSEFKYYYVAWKRYTFYIYLEQRFGIPRRFCTTLSYFLKHTHDIGNTIYQL